MAKTKIFAHKKFSIFILAILVTVGVWFFSRSGNAVDLYVLASAERGSVFVSVTGSGQVSAVNEVDLKAKTAGNIVYVEAENSQMVKAGRLLASFDDRDAQKAIRDATINLEKAKLNLEKMKGLQTPDGNIRGSREKAEADLERAYDDAFNAVSNTFLELPGIMAGNYDLLFGTTLGTNSQWNIDYYSNAVFQYDEKILIYRNDVYSKYQAARKIYDVNFSHYKSLSRFSDRKEIESIVGESYETVKQISETIKSANNLIQFYKDKLTERGLKVNSAADTHLSQLNSYTSKTNGFLGDLFSSVNSIKSNNEVLANVEFDLADQQIIVDQAQNSLQDAEDKLADYYIRAPFDGIISSLSVKLNDQVSNGTLIAKLTTKKQMAEISLNEIDVSKVKVSQPVALTFDAIEGLELAGRVAEVDTIGTVTQGVVNYTVKILFDSQDDRVRPGMSVSVAIITDNKQDVIIVPNSAVQVLSNRYFVQIAEASATDASSQGVALLIPPRQQFVEIGLVNDSVTEIISGLVGGEIVVERTISASSQKTAAPVKSSSLIPGLGGNTGISGGSTIRRLGN